MFAVSIAAIQEQGFIPLYKREKIADDFHGAGVFCTDYRFIIKN